jgi:hypothetical protein
VAALEDQFFLWALENEIVKHELVLSAGGGTMSALSSIEY